MRSRERSTWKFAIAFVVCLVTPIALLTFYNKGRYSEFDIEPQWECEINTTTNNGPPSCPQTVIFPFKVGCPAVCNRTDLDNNSSGSGLQPLYRFGLEWYFGQTNISLQGLGYDGGINFQSVPSSFVNQFATVMMNLENRAKEVLGPTTQFKRQERIHISLMYLCCLTKNEIYLAREYIAQWILENFPYDIPIQFDKLHCYRERYNSVTNILELDGISQKRLLTLNHNLRQYLQDKGIPVPVRREEQMRFHTTVLGMYYDDDPETSLPENDISVNLTTISKVIQSFENENWSTSTNGGIHIQHAPKMGTGPEKLQQHAGDIIQEGF